MPSILVFTGHRSLKIGGMEDYVAKLSAAATKDGSSEILFVENDYPSVPATIKSLYAEQGVQHHAEALGPGLVGRVRDINRIIRQHRPDIVHVHFQPISYIAVILAKLAGVGRVYWTKHSLLHIHRLSSTWFYHRIAMAFTDRIFSVSHAVDDELARLGLGEGKRTVLPLGVNLDRFSAANVSDDTRRRVRGELGIGDADFVITVVAQIRPVKRLDVFLRTVDILVNKEGLRHVKAFLVGGVYETDESARLDAEYRDFVRSAGLEENVTFLGVRDDVQALYSISHLSGLTSMSEGLGLALVEAAAMGLPLFGTNAGGIPEVVVDGENGVIVEPGDARRLAAKIKNLILDDALRQRYAEASRRITDTLYNMDAQVEKHARIYGGTK